MNKKIVRMPGNTRDVRKRNQVGQGYIPCEVSGRYLNIRDYDKNHGYVFIDVMTSDTNNNEDRKLTELVIDFNDLKRIINKIN